MSSQAANSRSALRLALRTIGCTCYEGVVTPRGRLSGCCFNVEVLRK